MRKNLNIKFALIFTTVLFFLFIVILITGQFLAKTFTREYVKDDVLNTHNVMQNEVLDIFEEINYGYTRIIQNENVSDFFSSIEVNQLEFKQIIDSSSLSKDYVNVVLSIDNVFYNYNDNYDLPRKSFVKEIVEGNGNSLYLGEIDNVSGYLMIGRHGQYNNTPYAIVFYINLVSLNNICKIIDNNVGHTYIITNDYLMVATSNINQVGKTIYLGSNSKLEDNYINIQKIDGSEKLITITKLNNQYSLDLYLISILDNSILQKDLTRLSLVLVVIAIITFVIVILLAINLANKTVKPIKALSKAISSVDFSEKRNLLNIGQKDDEIYELEKNYERMLERLYKLMDENKINMDTQRKLEIEALTMQINPHFLYNTLDAIAWMAKIKEQTEIENLVINLAKFFRLSLHKGNKYIYIKEEVELIEHFLEIEKVRFPNVINYICDIPEEIGNYKTLKLILQPIIENAIKHGFSENDGAGTIIIKAYFDNDDIILEVKDDGCGFVVQDDFFEPKANTRNGYGLYNVNTRIKLEYGEKYGLKIFSSVGIGTTVTVRIKKVV